MKTRMERYLDDEEKLVRTTKNQDMYQDMYNSVPSSNVSIISNESEVDISKIKELITNREGYKKIKEFQSVLKTSIEEDPYEDLRRAKENPKTYDINLILDDAKSKRETSERERYRNLKNTQYDILSKLNLNEQPEVDEMATDFFTGEASDKDFITSLHDEVRDKTLSDNKTSIDLFKELKGEDDTVLTQAVKEPTEQVKKPTDNTFYTSSVSFTKEDFEGFQNLQTTVKKNNTLIKILITFLVIALLSIVGFVISLII